MTVATALAFGVSAAGLFQLALSRLGDPPRRA